MFRAAGKQQQNGGGEKEKKEKEDDEEKDSTSSSSSSSLSSSSSSNNFPLSEEELADYVRSSVADALTSASSLSAFSAAAGGPSNSSSAEGIAVLGRAAAMATAAAPGLRGKVTYTRLATGPPPLDPFEGLYMGCFGPDGPELLSLRRVEVSSNNGNSSSSSTKLRAKEEAVVAVRLASDGLGADAGARLFSARIGKGQRSQGGGDTYPPELGVQARYPGRGYLDLRRSGVVRGGGGGRGGGPSSSPRRGGSFSSSSSSQSNSFSPFSMRGSISASRLSSSSSNNEDDDSEGHSDPNIAAVNGELLLFSGRSPVTRGATLGFCWQGDRDARRHLVLLSRVSLDDPSVRAKARAALGMEAGGK